MKKIIFLILIIILTLSLFNCKGCKRGQQDDDGTVKVKEATQYTNKSIYVYENEEEIGTNTKAGKWLKFGTKVKILGSKDINGKAYYNIKLSLSKKNYWGISEAFTKRFIVINKVNTECYDDSESTVGVVLQPGDFGVFLEENMGYIKVDFKAYRPYKTGGERKWVGTRWIKDGYTDDINTAKPAYYLYLATYYSIQEDNMPKAIEMMEEGIKLNKNNKDDAVRIAVEDYMNELQFSPDDESEIYMEE